MHHMGNPLNWSRFTRFRGSTRQRLTRLENFMPFNWNWWYLEH
uniref:Uncharacterized protein n=1 Tax=Arundo donax TaxID=35708 RepID=A0A0A9ABW0_ARUDO